MSILNNPYVDITVSLYFKVENANFFGGRGSEGYTKAVFEHCLNVQGMSESILEEQKNALMETFGVSSDEIHSISWEEYKEGIGEEDDEDGQNA